MKKTFVLLVMLFAVINACHSSKDDFDAPYYEQDANNVYIAVFGDIQYLTNSAHINIYQNSLNWIKNEMLKGKHFNCILHTGDVTENNRIEQWNLFFDATLPIANYVPYISLIGNHDYTWEGSHIVDRCSTHINDYIKFPITTQNVVSAFEEGRMENIVVMNEIYGQRYDLLLLEFGPRPEVVEWAEDWVASHPDIKYILMNHEYLEKGGGRRTTGLKCESQLLNTSYMTPDELWNKLIKRYDNILCVLCGHVGGLYAVTNDKNDYGRDVCQIQHNIQSAEYRYDNWLMIWKFPSSSDSVSVSIVNTRTGKKYNNQECLFKFKYRDTTITSIKKAKMYHKPIFGNKFNIGGVPVKNSKRQIQLCKDGTKIIGKHPTPF